MLRRGLLPESEVGRITLLLLPVERTGCGQQLIDIAAGEFPVMKIAVVLGHVEIYGAVAHIGVSAVEDFLHILDLLDNVA